LRIPAQSVELEVPHSSPYWNKGRYALANRWRKVFDKQQIAQHTFSSRRSENKRKKNKAMILARTLSKICCVAVLVTVALGCVMTQRTEDLLSQAGFKSVPANTPAQQTRLKALPADKITMVQRHGKEYFVFPDVSQNTLYVGQKPELENYEALRGARERAVQAEMNNSMVSPEWDEWEPWTGPYWH